MCILAALPFCCAGISIGMETTAASVVAIAAALIGSYVLGTTAAPNGDYEFIYFE